LPIDVMTVTADGHSFTAVAHVLARRRGRLGWWRGRIVAVMNVDHIGSWDVAPRAHPNDGWLDVVEVAEAMSCRARWQAWRRLETGTHLPHPDVATRRAGEVSFTFDPTVALWIDGVDRGDIRALRVSVEPDAAEIYI
jgi:diacylglycerol kinase family enzyme